MRLSKEKRRRSAALQDAGAFSNTRNGAKRFGVRQPSGALGRGGIRITIKIKIKTKKTPRSFRLLPAQQQIPQHPGDYGPAGYCQTQSPVSGRYILKDSCPGCWRFTPVLG
jgi:hypothetical protein